MSRSLGRIVAHIPARAGSKRVPSKNLRDLAGNPMISYAIRAAIAAPELDEVYVNTDSPELMALARAMGVGVYERDASLASDTASGDDFTMDIIEKLKPDTLVMISPVCPLVDATDISKALQAFKESDADTLITCTHTQLQTFCEDKPVNVRLGEPLAPSQDNPVVSICNWAVTVWDAKVFTENYRAYKGGYLGTKRLLFPIDPLHSVKVSYEEDFRLAEALILASRMTAANQP
jgi:CMP-N,N'-diacetyllegionaminic acid synthase